MIKLCENKYSGHLLAGHSSYCLPEMVKNHFEQRRTFGEHTNKLLQGIKSGALLAGEGERGRF